jgi:hypothetical protein
MKAGNKIPYLVRLKVLGENERIRYQSKAFTLSLSLSSSLVFSFLFYAGSWRCVGEVAEIGCLLPACMRGKEMVMGNRNLSPGGLTRCESH